MLLLSRSEVAALLDLQQAIAILEDTYRDQAIGKVDAVPPLRLLNRGMRLVAGRLQRQDAVGVRLSAEGGDAVALLFGISTGQLRAVMAYPFSELRISATLALALRHLAEPHARSAAVIGSGRLAPCLLEAAMATKPLERVMVYSRRQERREAFARRMEEQFGIPVQAATCPQEAIASADVVLVSTNSPEPAFLGKWLRPGLSVFGIGRPNEFDDEVYLRASLLTVSSKVHELGYYDVTLDQPLVRLSKAGVINWDNVAELGQVVSGQVSVRRDYDSILVFRESQGGYSDVALATWVYRQALERGLGTNVELG